MLVEPKKLNDEFKAKVGWQPAEVDDAWEGASTDGKKITVVHFTGIGTGQDFGYETFIEGHPADKKRLAALLKALGVHELDRVTEKECIGRRLMVKVYMEKFNGSVQTGCAITGQLRRRNRGRPRNNFSCRRKLFWNSRNVCVCKCTGKHLLILEACAMAPWNFSSWMATSSGPLLPPSWGAAVRQFLQRAYAVLGYVAHGIGRSIVLVWRSFVPIVRPVLGLIGFLLFALSPLWVVGGYVYWERNLATNEADLEVSIHPRREVAMYGESDWNVERVVHLLMYDGIGRIDWIKVVLWGLVIGLVVRRLRQWWQNRKGPTPPAAGPTPMQSPGYRVPPQGGGGYGSP